MIARLRATDVNFETHTASEAGLPTLVFIHGFGASLRTWDRVAPALGRQYSWVNVDLKGFGLSGHPRDGNYTIDENAAILCELLEQLQLTRVVLIGHSYGGAVAITAAIHLRQRPRPVVEGLVLIDAASYEQRLPFFVEALRHRVSRFFSGLTSVERSTRLVLRALLVNKTLVDAAMVERYAFPRRIDATQYGPTQTALQILPKSFEAVSTAIRSIDVPTQIIWGQRDNAVPLSFAHRLHCDIRGSRLDVLPRAGHMPHEECPEHVVRIVGRFLAALPCRL